MKVLGWLWLRLSLLSQGEFAPIAAELSKCVCLALSLLETPKPGICIARTNRLQCTSLVGRK